MDTLTQENEFIEKLGDILADHHSNNFIESEAQATYVDKNALGFARYLRAARNNAQRSEQQLAEKAGVSEAEVFALERGLILSTRLEFKTLRALAKALGEDIKVFALLLQIDIPKPNPIKDFLAWIHNNWKAARAYLGSDLQVVLLTALMGTAISVSLFVVLLALLPIFTDNNQPLLPAFHPSDFDHSGLRIDDLANWLLSMFDTNLLPSSEFLTTKGNALSFAVLLFFLLIWVAIWKGDIPIKLASLVYQCQRLLVYVTPIVVLCVSLLVIYPISSPIINNSGNDTIKTPTLVTPCSQALPVSSVCIYGSIRNATDAKVTWDYYDNSGRLDPSQREIKLSLPILVPWIEPRSAALGELLWDENASTSAQSSSWNPHIKANTNADWASLIITNSKTISLPSGFYGLIQIKSTHGMAWGDIDGDGDLDLAVGNNPGPSKIYLNNNGHLQATPAWVSPDHDQTTSVAWGDIDGDGDLDLAVGNNPGPSKIYLNNNGHLQATPAWVSPDHDQTTNVAIGDIDMDGNLDTSTAWDNSNDDAVLAGGTQVYQLSQAPFLTKNSNYLQGRGAIKPGDSLMALAPQDQQRFFRPYSYPYRLYKAVQQHPLILFNLDVSLEWNATEYDVQQVMQPFQLASANLYDITDGQVAFGKATIYDSASHRFDLEIAAPEQNLIDSWASKETAWPDILFGIARTVLMMGLFSIISLVVVQEGQIRLSLTQTKREAGRWMINQR